MIIHINGWPGVGKKTIGHLVSQNLNARFIHNHLLHDVAIKCAGIDSPERWGLYETIRKAAYDVLESKPKDETFIMTNALCKNNDREVEAWTHIVNLAISRQVPLIPIVLDCSYEENARRLQSQDRIGQKMTDHESLSEMIKMDKIQRPNVKELYELDVTHMSAEESSHQIVDYVHKNAQTFMPATSEHLQFK